MKTRICKNYKRIIAAALAVTMLCGTLTACGSNADTMGVTILEFDTAEDLAAIDRETLKNSSNTLYKVGDNYYSFFPSTGKMELVTKVQAYDETNIDVIDALYNSTITAEGKTPDVTETYVTSVTTLDNVLNTRTSYLARELDNCNANMLIDGADTIALKAYKTQLEEELSQLSQYKKSIVNTTELVVQSLKTQDVQDALMQQISELLDKQLTTVAKQNDYDQTVGLATEDSVKALEKVVLAQQSLIETLQQKYSDVDAILANKRVTLATATNLVGTAEFKNVIAQLDTYASSYVAECEKLYNSISTKADALESLYSTLQTVDNNDYTSILTTLQDKYAEMLQTQQELQTQIAALKVAVDSTESDANDSTGDGVYALLQTQLDKHEAELAALEDILKGTNLATIDSLADVQSTLQERIKGLENLQNSFKDTMTQQQIDALNELKSDIETSISNETSSTANDLRSYIDALTDNFGNLDSDTQKSIDALRKLLDDKDAEQNAVNTAVNTLISNLDANLTAQQTKLEEQKTMLVNLIDTTTGQVQSELMTALETSVNNQEQNLAAQRDTLTALINSSDADLAETLKTLFNERIDSSNTELTDAITALETALNADSNATADEITALRTALQDKFAEAVNTSETRLTQERETLETMMSAQKDSIVNELTTAIDTVDESRRADVEDILQRLQNSDSTNSETLNNAISDLRNVLDADITEQENKLADAKQVLIALMSEKDDKLTELLDSKVSSLDASVQTDVNNLIAALSDETANRAVAIEEAKTAVTNTLRESITTQEENLTDTTTTLNNFITATNASVDSLSATDALLEGNVATLSNDLTSLADAYNAYKQINNQTVSGLNSDLNSLTDAYNEYKQSNSQTVSGLNSNLNNLADNYAEYTQANDTVVTNLNTAIGTLDADYTAYKDATGVTISNLDTLLAAVKATTDTNANGLTELQTAVTTLTNDTVTNLQTVQAQLGNEVATLNTTVTDNYAELTAEVAQLTATVNDLTNSATALDTRVTTLESDASDTQTLIANLQSALTNVQTALDDKANASDVLTSLPIATTTDVGGVKVDNDTLKVMADGTLYINTAKLNQQTPNETIKVGTVWENYEDIPTAYREYCVQPNFVYMDAPPTEMFYKEVDEIWYMYSIPTTFSEQIGTPTVTETTLSNGSTKTTTTQYIEYTGTEWCITAKRPTTYITISTIPVTVCYYGYDPCGTGSTTDLVWEQYAVKYDTTVTTHEETFTTRYYELWSTSGSIYTSGGTQGISQGGRNDHGAGADVTRTYLDTWQGNYDKYGPNSGWKPASFKGAYLTGCTLNKAQRQKMWDAGVLTEFAASYYDMNKNSSDNVYSMLKHNFINGIAQYSSSTATNEDTYKVMPNALDQTYMGGNVAYPQSIFNFNDAGLAYKLAYLYGNHVWIYAGTPT